MATLWRIIGAMWFLLVAVPVATALPKWQQSPTPPPLPAADESGFASVNGISMYYSMYGKGRGSPILLIHGGMGSGDVWGFEVPALARRHEVIVADSRGQGRSSRTRDRLTYHLMAEDYVALLDHLALGKVALVGWSDGGIIGIDIALNHPERLSKLFAQAANVTPDGLTTIPTLQPRPAPLPQSSGGPDDRPSRQERRQLVQRRTFDRLWATEPHYSREDLRKIRVPTEIVVGDHDEVIRREHTTYIARSIPGAKLVVLKDVSHPALFQDPEQYLQAINAFIGK